MRDSSIVKTAVTEFMAGKGTAKELCKKYKLSTGYFYATKCKLYPKSTRLKTKRKAKQNIFDVPLHTSTPRVYVVACDIADLKTVIGAL